MNATPWDILDAILIAATFVVVIRINRPELLWGPAGLALYHIVGRFIINDMDNPVITLAAAQTCVAVGFLFSRVLSNYGRVIGSLFLLMSMSGVTAYLTDTVPPLGQGLGFNIWNFQSVILHIVAGLIIIGALRHAKLFYGSNRSVRD